MNKKLAAPDEMRMLADKFDEMMRKALGAPPPVDKRGIEPRPKAIKPKGSSKPKRAAKP